MTIIFDPIDIYANQFRKFSSALCRRLAYKPRTKKRRNWLAMWWWEMGEKIIDSSGMEIVHWNLNDFQCTQRTNWSTKQCWWLWFPTSIENYRERKKKQGKSGWYWKVLFDRVFDTRWNYFILGWLFPSSFTVTHVTGGHN